MMQILGIGNNEKIENVEKTEKIKTSEKSKQRRNSPRQMLKFIWNYNFASFSSERQAIMGFAILWIVFFHSSGSYSRFPVIATIKQFGNLGVDIFLLLSGMGLYYSALKLRGEGLTNSKIDAENRRISRHWVVEFYRKRIVRILPSTIVCLFPWYLYLYREQISQINLLRFLLDITALSYWIDGNNRGWYVALTIVMYALYPLIFLLIRGGHDTATKRWITASAIIILDITFNTVVAIHNPDWFGMVNLALGRVPIFIAGCFLAPSVRKKTEYRGLLLVSLLLGIGVFAVLMKYMEFAKTYAIWRYLYGILGFCVAVILSVVFQLLQKIRIGELITRFFAFFGKYTLEIYLTHTQLLTVLDEQLKPRLSGAVINVLAVVGSIALSIAIHEGLELITHRLTIKGVG